MPKFKVLRQIEHSLRLYLPAGTPTTGKAKSVAHGGDIDVDATGEIELSESEAAALNRGQIEPIRSAASAGSTAQEESDGAT